MAVRRCENCGFEYVYNPNALATTCPRCETQKHFPSTFQTRCYDYMPKMSDREAQARGHNGWWNNWGHGERYAFEDKGDRDRG